MRCHVCNAEVADGQKFCHECGQDLSGVTDRTEPIEAIPPADVAAAEASDAAAADPDDHGVAAGPATGMITAIDPDLPTQPLEPPTTIDPDLPTQPLGASPAGGASPDDDTGELPAPDDDVLINVWSDEHRVTVADPAALATTAMAAQAPGEVGVTTDPLPMAGPSGSADLFDGQPYIDELPPAREPFRLRVSFVLGLFVLVATLMASVADVVDIRTNRPVPGIEVGFRDLAVFGTNLPVAGFVGAIVMVLGALLSCFGYRWAAGLAGGGALALVGWAAMAIGLAEVPIARAEAITRDPSVPGPFTLTITRDLGYWLLVGVAAVSLVVFVMSLRMAGTGGRRGLNPWLAAIGAVGAVVAAAGPLIPLEGLGLDANFGAEGLPTMYFTGRLLQVGLLGLTGVLGFLSVRLYGLGMVAGGLSVSLYLWATSIGEFGDRPVGIGVANLTTTVPSTVPHAVTTVGVIVTFVVLVAATITAIVTAPRAG